MTPAGDAPRPRVIVIGAGVAGSVVASRLAERCDVVVVERGTNSAVIHDPTLAMKESGFLRGDESGDVPYPLGTGPGGGSRVNGMVFEHAPDEYWNALVERGLDVFADARAEQVSLVGEESRCDGVVDRALRAAQPNARPTMLATRNGARLTAWDRLAPRGVALHTGVTVARLRMHGERTVGVITRRGDELSADHVILCAGAISSAVIAARSGCIGTETRLLDHPALFIPVVGGESPSSVCTTYVGAVHEESGVSTMSVNGGAAGPGGLLVTLMSPRSSGRLFIGNESVSIDRGVLAEASDVDALSAGVRRVGRLLRHPAFSQLASPMQSMLAGDQWRDRVGDGVWHASGTLPMGIGERGPVDESGQLRGTANVWCMDASVFPVIPPSPPQASVMVIAGLLANRFLSLVTS